VQKVTLFTMTDDELFYHVFKRFFYFVTFLTFLKTLLLRRFTFLRPNFSRNFLCMSQAGPRFLLSFEDNAPSYVTVFPVRWMTLCVHLVIDFHSGRPPSNCPEGARCLCCRVQRQEIAYYEGEVCCPRMPCTGDKDAGDCGGAVGLGSGETGWVCLRNDLFRLEWDVKPYSVQFS